MLNGVRRVMDKVDTAMLRLYFLPRRMAARVLPSITFLPHKNIEIFDRQKNHQPELGDHYVSSYYLMATLGAMISTGAMKLTARREGISENDAVKAYALGLLAGGAGAIGAHHLEVAMNVSNSAGEGFWGFSWFGGLLLSVPVMLIYAAVKKVPVRKFLDALAIPGTLFHALARVGCLLAGDSCYGTATNLPWAVKIGNNLVHPTPLYHTLSDLASLSLLWALSRSKRFDGQLFLAGVSLHTLSRFIIEFWRTNPQVGDSPFSIYQIVSLGLCSTATALLTYFSLRRPSNGA